MEEEEEEEWREGCASMEDRSTIFIISLCLNQGSEHAKNTMIIMKEYLLVYRRN